MIILIGSNKGGTGKTTTALNLASILGSNNRVLLVDADNQQSLYQWNAIREDSGLDGFDCITSYGQIAKEVLEYSQDYDVTIVDAAGRNSEEFLNMLGVCDVFISPIQVTQIDLNTLINLNDQIELLKTINPNLVHNSFVLHSRATTNIFIQHQERKDLEDFVGELESLSLLNATISERKIFKDSSSYGKGIYDYQDDSKHTKALDEYLFLLEEIYTKGRKE